MKGNRVREYLNKLNIYISPVDSLMLRELAIVLERPLLIMFGRLYVPGEVLRVGREQISAFYDEMTGKVD